MKETKSFSAQGGKPSEMKVREKVMEWGNGGGADKDLI